MNFINRQQQRQRERAAQRFNQRQTFSKDEVKGMNVASYNLGVEHALEAVAIVFGLGKKRLDRVREKLEWLQYLDFKDFRNTGNVNQVKLNRDMRRKLNPSRKGKVLDE